jgi:iron-regulated transporter 1
MFPEEEPSEAIRLPEDYFHASEALLSSAGNAAPELNGRDAGSRSVLMRLYVSHTLSAWNSRMFEFGAVLFLASIFPGTLLYASIYALVRALSAVALSSWLGAQVDNLDRLVAVRYSIGMCCVVWR